MTEKCENCGTEVEVSATNCSKCGGERVKEQQRMQDMPPPQKDQYKNYFPLSIILGILGIVLSPMILVFIMNVSDSVACNMFYLSALFSLLAFYMGIVLVMKNKDMRGIIGIILAIIAGVLILIPAFAFLSIIL